MVVQCLLPTLRLPFARLAVLLEKTGETTRDRVAWEASTLPLRHARSLGLVYSGLAGRARVACAMLASRSSPNRRSSVSIRSGSTAYALFTCPFGK